MRRAIASLLLALFSFPLIAPLFAADAASQLPTCCRRDGKHHCSMTARDMETQGSGVQAIRPKCPHSSATCTFPNQRNIALLRNSQTIAADLLSDKAVQELNEEGHRAWFRGSHWKRGPPAHFS